MPSSHGISCRVKVNDQVCEEYSTEGVHEFLPGHMEAASNTVYRYIQLEADCKFVIEHMIEDLDYSPWPEMIEDKDQVKGFSTEYLTDGMLVCKGIALSLEIPSRWFAQHGRRYQRDGVWYSQDFITGSLSTTEDCPSHNTLPLSNMGQIAIKFYQANCRSIVSIDRGTATASCFPPAAHLPEKSLKGRDLQLAAGISSHERTTSAPSIWDPDAVDNEAFVEFVFLYRTKSMTHCIYY